MLFKEKSRAIVVLAEFLDNSGLLYLRPTFFVILLYYAFDSPILVTIRLVTNSFRCVGRHLGSE